MTLLQSRRSCSRSCKGSRARAVTVKQPGGICPHQLCSLQPHTTQTLQQRPYWQNSFCRTRPSSRVSNSSHPKISLQVSRDEPWDRAVARGQIALRAYLYVVAGRDLHTLTAAQQVLCLSTAQLELMLPSQHRCRQFAWLKVRAFHFGTAVYIASCLPWIALLYWCTLTTHPFLPTL